MGSIKTIWVACFLAGVVIAGQWTKAASKRMTFPGKEWQEATPESQGVNLEKLNAAFTYLETESGCDGIREVVVIRNGYMIWKGDNIDKKHSVASITKAFTSTCLGLLIDDSKCKLSDPAKDYESRLDCEYPEYAKITLRHLSNMTSGYDGEGGGYGEKDPCDGSETPFVPAAPAFSPGTMYSYWDDAMCMFGLVLTKIANGTLYDLFEERIAGPIGMNPNKWDWRNWGEIDGLIVNRSEGGVNITARELARFGHLILNRGNWDGKQLISTKWLDEAIRVQVPNTIKGRVDSSRQKSISARAVGTYGYHWWANGILADGTRFLPDVPLGTFYRSGWPQQRLFVIPEWNMVIVRLGLDKHRTDRPADARACWNTVLRMIGEAISEVSSEGQLNKQQAKDKQKNLVTANRDRIKPYGKNPRYWQYKRKPVLLLGGSKDDNLFQIPDLKGHLDLLASVGGNYIRNTMSSRSDKGFEVQPFRRLRSGKYDLNQWNDEYWNRFEKMLKLTQDRDIIVQVEVWAFHDFNKGHWEKTPWHPANNISYSESSTTLKDSYGNIGKVPHDFFFTVPKLNNDSLVLACQQKFVDKILSHSLRYGHVLYCMTNEIHPQFSPEWGWYWAGYIKDKAAAADKKVETTEMYWEVDLKKPQQRASLDRPDVFSFFEASQNSAEMGQQNWDNLQFAHHYLAEEPRPINHVKIYGADTSTWKGSTDRHATECFWRNIMGGSASSRFHRPPYGLGLGKKAQANIRSMRLLTDKIDIFTCAPRNNLLSGRKSNEAYCLVKPGEQYAVYFPDGGEVTVDISSLKGPAVIRWLKISTSEWMKQEAVQGGHKATLYSPGKGHWAVLISDKTQCGLRPQSNLRCEISLQPIDKPYVAAGFH